MKRVVDIVRNVIFLAAVCVIILSAACMLLQIKPAVVISGSMEPAIHTGSIVFIDEKKKEPDVGDIIAFEKGGVFITHRIAEKTADGYITKGDANKTADLGVLPRKAVIGTTEFSLPYLGYIVKTLSAPAGIIICAAVCSCLILASGLRYEK